MISGAVIPPKMNLNPPHYDGIQSLAISNDTLFSGSRDTCIKKWDLSRQELVTVIIPNIFYSGAQIIYI